MFTVSEIKAQLIMDPELKYFFVEGNRDLAFWRKLVPMVNRKNSQVIKIGLVTDVIAEFGGEKGRLIELSNNLENVHGSHRVTFFVDSDNDKLINKTYLNTVFLTDHRDLESYCFSIECLREITDNGLAKANINLAELMETIKNICISIGLLRAISEEHGYGLGFQKIFEKKGRNKFLINKSYNLNIDKLIKTLVQNAKLPFNMGTTIMADLNARLVTHTDTDVKEIMQGKDWLFFLSSILNLDPDSAEPLAFLALDYSQISTKPQLTRAVDFLTLDAVA